MNLWLSSLNISPAMIRSSCHLILVLISLASTFAFPPPAGRPKRDPIIESPSGTYRGKYVDLDGDNLEPVVQFLGIPYAQTMGKERRWELPKKREAIRGEYDATKFRYVCPQPSPAPSPLLPIWLRKNCPKVQEMMREENMREDCLYLNIYIPGKYFDQNTTNFLSLDLPVMMYFHGHTFSDGAGSLYDGSALSSYGNVIVVTFNYRLGVLGFMSSGEDWMKGNFGLYDQIRANDWVLENIQSFGGDCKKITAFGSGAGGSSIGLLMLSPQGEAKFKRAILQSGSPLTSWAMEENPKQSFDAFVNSTSIDCYSNETAGIMKCLKKKSWKDLVNAAPGLDQNSWRFGPVVDKQLLLGPPRRLMEEQEFINYEVIIGVTSDDGFGFAQSRLGLNPNETCNMVNGFSEENIYKQENFVADIVNFVSKSFGDGNYTDLIRDTIRFVYTDWRNKETKNSWMKALIDLYTDKRIVLPAIQTAEYHSHGQNPTYFYTFNQNPGKSPGRSWLGAIHAEELPYIFGAPLLNNGMDLYPYKFDNDDKMLSSALITYWVNFADNGDPNIGKAQVTDFNTGNPNLFNKVEEWPQYRNETKKYLNILYSPEVKDYYRSDKMAFWRSFVPGFKKKRLAPKSCQKPVQKGQETSTNDYYTSYGNKNGGRKDTSPSGCNSEKKQGDTLCKIVAISIAVFLFCVSAVIFALMSYQKDKHRFQLEKLRTDLKTTQKRDKSESGSHRTHGERDSKRKIVEEKSSSSHGKSHSKHKKSSTVALPIPSDDPAHPKTLPMKSCLKVGGSTKASNGMDFCKIRVSKVVTSPSTLSSQTVMGHANTLRSQMISTERFAELEGIRCITLGRRRCNSALASTLLKQTDSEQIKLQNEPRKMPAPPVQFTQTPVCSNDLLAYKPLDGSVRSLTLNRSNFRHGNGPYGTVQTTQRPLFQSQVMVGQPVPVGMDSDRKPLLCRTRAINVKEGFSTLPMAREDVATVTTKNS